MIEVKRLADGVEECFAQQDLLAGTETEGLRDLALGQLRNTSNPKVSILLAQQSLEGRTIRVRAVDGHFLPEDTVLTTRTLLTPTTQEIEGDGELSIWIGMLPHGAAMYTPVAIKEKSFVRKKGSAIIINAQTKVLSLDTCALRVVSIVTHKQSKPGCDDGPNSKTWKLRRLHP